MFHITEKKINIEQLINQARHPESGALVVFSGEARSHHDGKSVTSLEYEAQTEMAEKSIINILDQAKKRWPLNFAAAVHRVGRVEISEPAVVVIVSAAHRKEAFEACQFIIDAIKAETPIWKKEFFVDGNTKWQ